MPLNAYRVDGIIAADAPIDPIPISPNESSLNVNVPEFHPRDYVPKVKQTPNDTPKQTFELNECINDDHLNEIIHTTTDLIETKQLSTENDSTSHQPETDHHAIETGKNLRSKKVNNWRKQQFNQVNSKADLVNKYSKINDNDYDNKRNEFAKPKNKPSYGDKVKDRKPAGKEVGSAAEVAPAQSQPEQEAPSTTYAQMLCKKENAKAKKVEEAASVAAAVAAEQAKKVLRRENIPKKLYRKEKRPPKLAAERAQEEPQPGAPHVGWRTVCLKGRKRVTPAQGSPEVDEISFDDTEPEQIEVTVDVVEIEAPAAEPKVAEVKAEDATAATEVPEAVEAAHISKKSKKSRKRKTAQAKLPKASQADGFDIIEPIFDEFSINDITIDPQIFADEQSIAFSGFNGSLDPYSSAHSLRKDARLKEEEELVIRILQQLHQSDGEDSNETLNASPIQSMDDWLSEIFDDNGSVKPSIRRYSINAKPYQNIYSSNHFLGHFFGDKDDKRKHSNDDLTSSSSGCDAASDVRSSQDVEAAPAEPSEATVDAAEVGLTVTEGTAASLGGDEKEIEEVESVLKSDDQEKEASSEETEPESRQAELRKREKLDSVDSGMCLEQEQSLSSLSASESSRKLLIVDTGLLEQQKKLNQTFPITAAVTLWLDQMKEQTPEPILRFPSAEFLGATFDELFLPHGSCDTTDNDSYSTDDSSGSHNEGNKRSKYFNLRLPLGRNRSLDLTECTDTDEDEEGDSGHYWEMNAPPSPLAPQTPPSSPQLQHSRANLRPSGEHSIVENAIKHYQETINLHSKPNDRKNASQALTSSANETKTSCTIM